MSFKSSKQRKAFFALQGRGYKKTQFYFDVEHPQRKSLLPYARRTDERYLGRDVYIDSKGHKYIEQSLTGKAVRVKTREKGYKEKIEKERLSDRRKVARFLGYRKVKKGKYNFEIGKDMYG